MRQRSEPEEPVTSREASQSGTRAGKEANRRGSTRHTRLLARSPLQQGKNPPPSFTPAAANSLAGSRNTRILTKFPLLPLRHSGSADIELSLERPASRSLPNQQAAIVPGATVDQDLGHDVNESSGSNDKLLISTSRPHGKKRPIYVSSDDEELPRVESDMPTSETIKKRRLTPLDARMASSPLSVSEPKLDKHQAEDREDRGDEILTLDTKNENQPLGDEFGIDENGNLDQEGMEARYIVVNTSGPAVD